MSCATWRWSFHKVRLYFPASLAPRGIDLQQACMEMSSCRRQLIARSLSWLARHRAAQRRESLSMLLLRASDWTKQAAHLFLPHFLCCVVLCCVVFGVVVVAIQAVNTWFCSRPDADSAHPRVALGKPHSRAIVELWLHALRS
jgi:hypothetical protein